MKPPFGIGKEKWFVDNGYGKPRGTVHVGVNDGTELGWYLQEGQVPILGFEPYLPVYNQTCLNFRKEIEAGLIKLYDYALSDEDTIKPFYVPTRIADGIEATQGISLLKEFYLDSAYRVTIKQAALVNRFDHLAEMFKWNLSSYNLLVVDVQGMELQVLKGFGKYLFGFIYLVVECSETSMYEGEASAQEVCDFLWEEGFQRMSPILSHNDVLFLRRYTYV